MKNKLKNIILSAILFSSLYIGSPNIASATVCLVQSGCTGVGTLNGIPYGTGTAPFSTVTIGAGLSFIGGTLTSTGAGTLIIGSTTLTSGTSGRILYDNAGILSELTTTGSGNVVLDTSPTLITPNLGTPSTLILTNATGLPLATGISGLGTGIATFLGTPSSANLASAITDETGSGVLVFANTPTIITPSFTTGFTIGGVAASGKIIIGNGTDFVASAYTVASPGTSGNVLTSDGTNWTSSAPVSQAPNFGDGSDGNVTISSPTTLTRDMYYNNLTVNDVLSTGGWRIFVKGTLSGNGTIQNNGTAGGNGANAGSCSLAGGGTPSSVIAGYFSNSIGGAGGNGGVSVGNGVDGSSAPNPSSVIISSASSIGGIGGTNSAAGGNGGAATTPTVLLTKLGIEKSQSIDGLDISSTGSTIKIKPSLGGNGGGGGGGNGCNYGGGGGAGGNGGGIVLIIVNNWAGTFSIHSLGGNGGTGGNGFSGAGGGGGAGGNGGVTIVIYNLKTWSGSYTVTGGIGGSPGISTSPTAGANGSAGTSYELQINTLL